MYDPYNAEYQLAALVTLSLERSPSFGAYKYEDIKEKYCIDAAVVIRVCFHFFFCTYGYTRVSRWG